MKTSEPIIGSYVFHGDKAWNVSTINRESSAALGAGIMYWETLVWEWDADKKVRGKLVHQDEGWDAHFAICKSLIDSGKLPERSP